MKLKFTPMVDIDLPQVAAIEQQSFTEPVSLKDLNACLLGVREVAGLVAMAQQTEMVIGYVLYEQRRRSTHVMTMAVHPEHRLRGVGRKLLQRLIRSLNQTRRRLTITLPETNLPACKFLRACGIQGRLKRGHYGTEDAIRFVHDATPSLEAEQAYQE